MEGTKWIAAFIAVIIMLIGLPIALSSFPENLPGNYVLAAGDTITGNLQVNGTTTVKDLVVTGSTNGIPTGSGGSPSLAAIQTACTNDFHNIGGTDDDVPDNDAEVPDAITVNAQAGSTWDIANSITPVSITGGNTLTAPEVLAIVSGSGGFTLDTEWNTLAKFETATGTNVMTPSELSSTAKLEALTGDDYFIAGDGGVDTTEFSYLNGVTSAIQTQIDSISTSGGTGSMSVTFVVASVNAGTNIRNSADYVCDGIDDEVQLQAANDNAGGGIVRAIGPDFYIDSGTLTINNCTLICDGQDLSSVAANRKGTKFEIEDNLSTGILITPGGNLKECWLTNEADDNFNGNFITMYANDEGFHAGHYLENVGVIGYAGNSTGLFMWADGDGATTNSSKFSSCVFGPMDISSSYYGVRMLANNEDEGGGNKAVYINGVYFSYMRLTHNEYALYMEAEDNVDEAEIAYNYFGSIDAQTNSSNNIDVITMNNCKGNVIENLMCWDWGSGTNDDIADLDSACDWNVISGFIPRSPFANGYNPYRWIEDDGRHNQFNSKQYNAYQHSLTWDDTVDIDHNFEGISLEGSAAEALGIGEVVRLDSSGNWEIATSGGSPSASGLLGICLNVCGGSGSPMRAGIKGTLRDDSYNWGTPGQELWLISNGDMSVIPPVNSGSILRICGYVGNDAEGDEVWFDPSKIWTEIQ